MPNLEVYGLLRYGMKVQPDVGERTITVWLIGSGITSTCGRPRFRFAFVKRIVGFVISSQSSST